MVVSVGIAYAAFLYTVPITGNTVSAASADLEVTATKITGVEFIPGQSTSEETIVITNKASKGNLTFVVSNKIGNLCADVTLVVKKGATELYNGTVKDAGMIAVDNSFNKNATITLTQKATLSLSTVLSGESCTWDETVKLENN